jgi:hypothetical protein
MTYTLSQYELRRLMAEFRKIKAQSPLVSARGDALANAILKSTTKAIRTSSPSPLWFRNDGRDRDRNDTWRSNCANGGH